MSINIPRINFQMEGGSDYPLLNPIVVIGLDVSSNAPAVFNIHPH